VSVQDFDEVRAKTITLLTPDTNEPAVSLSLSTNNVKPLNSQMARLGVRWLKDYPAEIEIEPGPDCQQPNGSAIITEVMLWGKRRADRGRNRLTLQINVDPAGGEYALLDSSTNDPSGSVGQGDAMPILINRGEAQGIYIGIYPGNTLLIQNRLTGKEIRIPIEKLIQVLGA
jgi:hypothetical protein